MENTLRTPHLPKFLRMPVIFSIIYILGGFGFLGLWLGVQSIPGFADFEKYGLSYALVCLAGAISNIAIMRGKRWGIIGQIGTWSVNFAINGLLHREVGQFMGLAIVLVGLWGFDIYRNRRSLN